MTDPFRSPEDYELFLYTLTERFPSIQRSTLVRPQRALSRTRLGRDLLLSQNPTGCP